LAALQPVSILVLAWGLAGVCREAQTGAYLAQVLSGQVAPTLIPVVTFFVASLTAFATGTSWATMAIVLPVAVPWAYGAGGEAIAFIAAASVMDGAIFGDHCSPISDTTVISAVSASCDLMDHVRTQLPYALTAMAVAAAVGYVPVAVLGVSPWLSYALGLSLLVAMVRLLGRSPIRT
jgi:Na+/H+ antiporter NhaC